MNFYFSYLHICGVAFSNTFFRILFPTLQLKSLLKFCTAAFPSKIVTAYLTGNFSNFLPSFFTQLSKNPFSPSFSSNSSPGMVEIAVWRFPGNRLRKRSNIPEHIQGRKPDPEHSRLPPEGPILPARPVLRPVRSHEAKLTLQRRQRS